MKPHVDMMAVSHWSNMMEVVNADSITIDVVNGGGISNHFMPRAPR
jgi:hypothetical protein